MSDRTTSKRRRLTVKRNTALLTLVLAVSFGLTPYSAFAQTPPEESTQQATTPTMTCSERVPPYQPEDQNLLEEIIDPQAAPSSWTPLQVTGVERTRTTMTWQWTTPTSTDKPNATFSNYGIELYHGETLVTSAELTLPPQDTQYSHPGVGDGHYRFLIWIIESTNGKSQPTGCESFDTTLDTTPPVINGKTYTQSGNKATPQLSTDETDLTLDWMVDASVDDVTISDPSQLNPTFTFLKDGTYTFTLTATDSLGNAPTTVVLKITYEAPFAPETETPVIPITDPAPIDPFTPPQEVLVQTKRAVLDSYNYGATAYDVTEPDVAVQGSTTTSGGDPPLETVAAAPLDSSKDGWVILGVPWYWWLLGSGGITAGVLWYRNYFLKNMPTDI